MYCCAWIMDWLLTLQAFKAALAICAWACQPEINEDLGARS